MRGLIWQPWITVEGVANQSVFQRATEWFDTTNDKVVIPYVEIINISGAGATLTIQTGGTVDVGSGTGMFQKLVDGSGNGATYTTIGMQVLRAFRFSDGQTPPAQILRWLVTGTAAWSISFRIALGLLERKARTATRRSV